MREKGGFLWQRPVIGLDEKPDAYLIEYENSLSYRLEIKGRVEYLSYEAFRNMEMQGRGEEILDGTEGRS